MQAAVRKLKVLFLCTGNSCRSQMAEGWARQVKGGVIEAYSAGIEKHGIDPHAVKVMAEAGVDISKQYSKTPAELGPVPFDYVVTVCGHANENCPIFPGKAKRIHVGFEDPPKLTRNMPEGEEKLAVYRRVRDEIRLFVEGLPGALDKSEGRKKSENRGPKLGASMKTKSEVAVEKFLSGYNCAQAVLYAYGPSLGLDGETALKVATGLGGGMGGRGEVCGAVTGGILALGLKYGRGGREEKSVAQQAYQKTEELMGAFERVHGSCICRTLLCGCDLRTPEGMRRFREEDLHHKTCVRCVQTVGEILAGMLDAPEAQGPAVSK